MAIALGFSGCSALVALNPAAATDKAIAVVISLACFMGLLREYRLTPGGSGPSRAAWSRNGRALAIAGAQGSSEAFFAPAARPGRAIGLVDTHNVMRHQDQRPVAHLLA